ncbi:MAG: hypothetical protein U0667_01345 [Chloroflexota bacterium]
MRVLDGRGVRADRATVLIQDGRIEAITDLPSAPDGSRRIDGTGMTLVPGLMNAHVHVTMDGSADPAGSLAAAGGVARSPLPLASDCAPRWAPGSPRSATWARPTASR